MNEVTGILSAIASGEPRAAEQLLPIVYGELRRLAAHKLASERPGQTLQATALVHEAWLPLVREEDRKWDNPQHFFCAAAQAMRRILIDNARRKKGIKHSGKHRRTAQWRLSRSWCNIHQPTRQHQHDLGDPESDSMRRRRRGF